MINKEDVMRLAPDEVRAYFELIDCKIDNIEQERRTENMAKISISAVKFGDWPNFMHLIPSLVSGVVVEVLMHFQPVGPYGSSVEVPSGYYKISMSWLRKL